MDMTLASGRAMPLLLDAVAELWDGLADMTPGGRDGCQTAPPLAWVCQVALGLIRRGDVLGAGFLKDRLGLRRPLGVVGVHETGAIVI
jgi:hypothetical protein